MSSANGNNHETSEWTMDDFIRPDLAPKCLWGQNQNGATNPHIARPLKDREDILPNILHAIGNTPLVKLNNIPKAEGIKCEMYAKCEFLNPGGSLKDRIGFRMVEDCEEKGLIQPGFTLIEPTSGNTGIGIAMASAVKGYRCIIVMPEKMSDEKVQVLKALGAEIIRTPTEAAFDSPDSLISVSQKLQRTIPNSYILNQYRNESNPLAHYEGTGAEILKQLNGNVDMVVIGAGTGGCISGIGRRMKDQCPSCTVVGVDPYGSILAQPPEINETKVELYEVEGIGYDFIPSVLDRSVVDKWIKTNDQDALPMSRRLIKEEGMLCGASSGSVLWGALQAAKELHEGQKCVVILPDNIRNYMTKFVSDSWMIARNFMHEDKHHWWWNKTVADLKLPKLNTARPKLACKDAIGVMKIEKTDFLVMTNSSNEYLGHVTDKALMSKLIDGKCSLDDCISTVAIKKILKVQKDTHLGRVARILEKEPFVLVQDSYDAIVSKISTVDLLSFIKS